MTPNRDAHSLRAALEEVTPAAPHLVHTVMAAVRATASGPGPRLAAGPRLMRPAAGAAVLAAVLIAVIGVSVYWMGGIGRSVASHQRSNGPQGASSVYKSMDSVFVGSSVSANEAWIVQFHESVQETQPGFYTTQPGTTPFSTVSRTTDGGRSWVRKLRFNGMYDSMRFSADGRRGVIWPTNGSVYRTVDGGDHWSTARIPDGLFVYHMTFLDPDQGWAVLYPSVSAALTAYATSDGGQTWEPRGGLDLTGDPTSARTLGNGSGGLQFSDASHGLYVPAVAGRSSGWPVFLVTSDGGQSWQRVGPAIAPEADTSLGMSASLPTIFANGSGVLLVIDSANRLYVYSTTNYGSTWSGPRRVALPSLQGTGQVGRRMPQKTWIADARHWWVQYVVANGKVISSLLFTTADAGQHWTSLPSSPLIGDVVFASPAIGWAVNVDYWSSSKRLARTTDAGAHWTTLALPPAVDS
jgi:photosystem II stability/assembly factor-like uncharacterized protein